MKKLKVATFIGTRPEIIRLSRVIAKLDRDFDHILVHTGQNYDYELNEVFFEDLEIRKPNFFLDSAGSSSAETIAKVIQKSDKLLTEISPEAVLVLGDTNSCLSLLSAKRKKIPTFHMEAGNRCFDMRVPEEINRKIVDHIADINLPYSTIARDYLIGEGLNADMIIKTGSPISEVISFYKPKILASEILDKLKLKENNYFLVSAHREENIEDETNFVKLFSILNRISEIYNLPIIVSTHPRTKKNIEEFSPDISENIQLVKPLAYSDYMQLQINSSCVLSDSGTINEESSLLNFRALNLRESFERPEAMEEASVMMVGLSEERVLQAIEILKHQSSNPEERNLTVPLDYEINNVSEKVSRIILSYTDYVNRVVWKKY